MLAGRGIEPLTSGLSVKFNFFLYDLEYLLS